MGFTERSVNNLWFVSSVHHMKCTGFYYMKRYSEFSFRNKLSTFPFANKLNCIASFKKSDNKHGRLVSTHENALNRHRFKKNIEERYDQWIYILGRHSIASVAIVYVLPLRFIHIEPHKKTEIILMRNLSEIRFTRYWKW